MRFFAPILGGTCWNVQHAIDADPRLTCDQEWFLVDTIILKKNLSLFFNRKEYLALAHFPQRPAVPPSSLLQHTWRSADQRQCHRSELTQKPKRWTVPAMKKTLLGGETTVVPILFVGNIYVCVSILYIYIWVIFLLFVGSYLRFRVDHVN